MGGNIDTEHIGHWSSLEENNSNQRGGFGVNSLPKASQRKSVIRRGKGRERFSGKIRDMSE